MGTTGIHAPLPKSLECILQFPWGPPSGMPRKRTGSQQEKRGSQQEKRGGLQQGVTRAYREGVTADGHKPTGGIGQWQRKWQQEVSLSQ